MRAKRVWESSKKLGDKFVVSLGCNAMEKLGAGVLRHETIACIFSQRSCIVVYNKTSPIKYIYFS